MTRLRTPSSRTGGEEVASHADIDDEGQTVKLVSPSTRETAGSNGERPGLLQG